jgi:hypothetical protein
MTHSACCTRCRYVVAVRTSEALRPEWQCRAAPPVLVDGLRLGTWPQVLPHQWCGQFSPAPLGPREEPAKGT